MVSINKFLVDQPFQASYFVAKPAHGQRYVITDVHGFYDTFCALLNKIQLRKSDQLFLLGDYIDKGKKGKEVLDLMLCMIEQGYALFPLRGNHEDLVLKSHHKERVRGELHLPTLSRTKGIRGADKKLYTKYLLLLDSLPYYYELDDYLLVHAGFDFSKTKPFTDYASMMWITKTLATSEQLKGKTLVHGHVKNTLAEITRSVIQRQAIIGLDNATILANSKCYGNMVCLNLDSYELSIQANIDKLKVR